MVVVVLAGAVVVVLDVVRGANAPTDGACVVVGLDAGATVVVVTGAGAVVVGLDDPANWTTRVG